MIERVIESRRRDLGGFQVGRVLPQAPRAMVGPFVFFDHMGPMTMPAGLPRDVDVRPHPHIGLSTVTYLFEGEITHRDSVGSQIAIRPGEVNWMTAGRGITHSERFDTLRRTGGPIHGIQTWVALPRDLEEIDPAFAHHGPEDLPTYEAADGLWARLIAGEAFGARAAVKTHSPLFYVHWRLAAAAEVMQCATVTGSADYELRIVTRDMHAFDAFLREKILSLGLVSNIESRIVIRSVKNTTAAPLELLNAG